MTRRRTIANALNTERGRERLAAMAAKHFMDTFMLGPYEKCVRNMDLYKESVRGRRLE